MGSGLTFRHFPAPRPGELSGNVGMYDLTPAEVMR